MLQHFVFWEVLQGRADVGKMVQGLPELPYFFSVLKCSFSEDVSINRSLILGMFDVDHEPNNRGNIIIIMMIFNGYYLGIWT